MNKKIRQYIGLIVALIVYYIVHEGAHFLYALAGNVFKCINFMGALGVQVDVYREQMNDTMLAEFCMMGPAATLVTAWILVSLSKVFCKPDNLLFKACMYYVTIIMLFLDPVYLSFLYRFVGGGDMNGLKLLFPEQSVAIVFGIILVIHVFAFVKFVLPVYKESFKTVK